MAVVIAPIVSGVLSLLGPRAAEACSPPEPAPGYAAIVRHVPSSDATEVATNGTVILDLEEHGQPKEVTVSVVEVDTAATVEGTASNAYWEHPFVLWRPTALLRARTAYRVDAAVISEAARPANAGGDAQLSFTFTTGDGPLPPIESQGTLQVLLAPYVREVSDYSACQAARRCTSCGCGDCVPQIRRLASTRALLTLPTFSGGLAEPGYSALVRVTANQPYQFPPGFDATATGVLATGSQFPVLADTPAEIVIEGDLDRQAIAHPCFALRVTDLAGNARDVEPVCLNETITPAQSLTPPGGCSVAGRPTGDNAALALAAALLSWRLAAGARRRRRLPPQATVA